MTHYSYVYPHPYFSSMVVYQPYLPSAPNPYTLGPNYRQEYPEVDADLFFKSANAFKQLMADASHILNTLSADEQLAYNIMDAAQKGESERVEELIKSTGVQGKVDVDYNPDGIHLHMKSEVEGSNCCNLSMALRWR